MYIKSYKQSKYYLNQHTGERGGDRFHLLTHSVDNFDREQNFKTIRQIEQLIISQLEAAGLVVPLWWKKKISNLQLQELWYEVKALNPAYLKRTTQAVFLTSPVMSLSSVDFPAPFGPTRANRVSRSSPNSKFL